MEVQRSPDEYIELVRKAGFRVDDPAVLTRDQFWSRPDFGLLEWLDRPSPRYTEASQLVLIASKPLGPV